MVTVTAGNKKYSFDPMNMTILQWEGAEREVIAGRYYDLLDGYADFCLKPDNAVPQLSTDPVLQAEQVKNLTENLTEALLTEKDKQTSAMIAAADYMDRRVKTEREYSRILTQFHVNITNNGGRLRMVAALLIEEGKQASEKMREEIKINVIPFITPQEVDSIIQNFMNSTVFVEGLSKSYLRKPAVE